MSPTASRRPRVPFGFDASSLERLLAFIEPDGQADRAGAYRRLREKVEAFFRWRGVGDSGALDDETLDRVARRVQADEVRTASPGAFVLGVARMVALEAGRKDRRDLPLESDVAEEAPQPEVELEVRLQALDGCLDALVPAEKHLVLTYYRDEGNGLIDGRRRLAEELGATLPVLRVRAFRVRARVERCVEGKLGVVK